MKPTLLAIGVVGLLVSVGALFATGVLDVINPPSSKSVAVYVLTPTIMYYDPAPWDVQTYVDPNRTTTLSGISIVLSWSPVTYTGSGQIATYVLRWNLACTWSGGGLVLAAGGTSTAKVPNAKDSIDPPARWYTFPASGATVEFGRHCELRMSVDSGDQPADRLYRGYAGSQYALVVWGIPPASPTTPPTPSTVPTTSTEPVTGSSTPCDPPNVVNDAGQCVPPGPDWGKLGALVGLIFLIFVLVAAVVVALLMR